MSSTILIERRGDVTIVCLNAPAKRNAISTEMRVALRERLLELGIDRSCRAIVLTGANGQFCAGGDLSEMTQSLSDPLIASRRLQILHDSIRAIVGGAKPVVAAVEGAAAGAGLSLAAACDVLVASQDARFVASFVKVGLVADCGLQFTLSARIGPHSARRLLLAGETVPAERAHSVGLVDELTLPGEALERAIVIATGFAQLPPLALAAAKSSFARGIGSLEEALALESDLQSRLAATEDHQEAKAAFLERRSPVFKGI